MKFKFLGIEVIIHKKEARPTWYMKKKNKCTPRDLLCAIADIMKVSCGDMKHECRKQEIVKARAVYSYLGRKMGFTYRELGLEINRDHSDIVHHSKRYTDFLEEDEPWFRPELKEEINYIKDRLSEGLIFVNNSSDSFY